MNYLHLESLVLRLLIILFGVRVACANETATERRNASKEITKLFSERNATQTDRNRLDSSGLAYRGNKIFEEGSTSTVNLGSVELNKNVKNSLEDGTLERVDGIHLQQPIKAKFGNRTDNTVRKNGSKSSLVNQSRYSIMLQKMSETTLGMDELTHSNGTSSIKPRKGVEHVKVVPRKGVDFEDYLNHTLSEGHACFAADRDKCYDVEDYKHINCTCCQIANDLGKMIMIQPLINCNTCLSLSKIPGDSSEPCNDVCCENTSQSKLEGPSSDSERENDSSILTGGIYHDNDESKSSLNVNKSDVNFNGISLLSNSLKATKLKPSVTNVPYDSDTPSNHFSKSKGEKYVPIIVSVFIVPVVGIFIFFTWKKTRELWDRRYYKRMDVLIDGIYND